MNLEQTKRKEIKTSDHKKEISFFDCVRAHTINEKNSTKTKKNNRPEKRMKFDEH
jgi:hypothetical protein